MKEKESQFLDKRTCDMALTSAGLTLCR